MARPDRRTTCASSWHRHRAITHASRRSVQASAYRIVQEAVTNALKHAGKRAPGRSCATATGAVELEVSDDGPALAAPAGGGHGLVGMRERAAIYGGVLSAGRRRSAASASARGCRGEPCGS